jgi:hypothetical protein
VRGLRLRFPHERLLLAERSEEIGSVEDRLAVERARRRGKNRAVGLHDLRERLGVGQERREGRAGSRRRKVTVELRPAVLQVVVE